MANVTNKQRTINQIFSSLGKGVKAPALESKPVLEQFLYAICREGATKEGADAAFTKLQERFFDWNEVRVSSVREIADCLHGIPSPEQRAQRIIDFLQEVFETTFSFDLDWLHKKGLKQSAKQLSRYQAADDYTVAWVVQQSLGGHAIPLDAAGLRALDRLGIIDSSQGDAESVRTSVEHHVPKAKGPLFSELICILTDEYCFESEPNCSGCPLSNVCVFGQEAKTATPVGSRGKSR